MFFKKTIFAIVLSASSSAFAVENAVMVDLSVLGNLSPVTETYPEPLFPIVAKQKKTVKPVQKTIKKPVEAKVLPQKEIITPEIVVGDTKPIILDETIKIPEPVAIEIIKPEENIVVVDVEPVSEPQPEIAPTQEPKVESTPEPKPIVKMEQKSIAAPGSKVKLTPEPKPIVRTDEPIAVSEPKVEPDLKVNTKLEKQVQKKDNIPVLTEQKMPVVESTEKARPIVEFKQEAKQEVLKPLEEHKEIKLEVPSKEPVVEAKQDFSGLVTPSQSVAPSEVKKEEDLSVVNPNSSSIVFAEDEDELSPEQMARLDQIVGRFKNGSGNKIAIFTYNISGGENSFKRKRISLNRAIDIRSYLIKQGYKNFSIKVININADSKKANTVELEEI